MKLLERLLHGMDVYKACPTYEKPVGFFSSKTIFSEVNEIFVTNHRLLMDTTDVYKNQPSKEKIKIGRVYAIERALLHYIAVHGSIFRYDDRKGAIVNGFIPPILSKDQLSSSISKNDKKLSSELLEGIFELLKIGWTEDFPSFRDLHNFLSDIFAKRHGLKACQASPSKQNPKTFKAKSLRDESSCDDDLEKIEKLVGKIIQTISKNKFDIFEVQYGFNWQKVGLAEWYLNIDTFLSLRSSDVQNVLNNHAMAKFQNVGSLHTQQGHYIAPVHPGFGTPLTSTQNSDKANSLDATINLPSSSSSSPSQNDPTVLKENTNVKGKKLRKSSVPPEKPKLNLDSSSDLSSSPEDDKNKENVTFKTPPKPTNSRVLRPKRSSTKKSPRK